MCKVLNIHLGEADKIAKSFEDFEIEQIDAMIKDEIPTSASAKDAISYVKQYPELFDYVRKLNGLPKSFGLHACGRIVATADLDTYLPSCYDKDGIRFLQGDMHDVEDVGLVKIDLLGLRTLDQEYDTLEMSGETKEFLNPKQDFSDPKVLDIFRNGDTVGIFQMSSYGMKDVLKKMEVSGIGDLSVANALYRPGSLKYIENYCNRKKGVEQFEYLHPDLEPILKETYGIIVYQEQLIDIGRLAGMRNPDLLRKATAKKNTQLLAQIKPELQEKLYKRGWSEKQFEKLWSDMIDFASYSFNKCVAGDTVFVKPMNRKDRRNPTVEEMYLITHDLQFANSHNYQSLRYKYRRNGYGSALSMFPDGKIRKNKIIDIQPSSVRKIYRLTTQSGKYIDCTDNHKIPTPNGIKLLSELAEGDVVFILGTYKQKHICYNLTNGVFESNIPKKGECGFQHRPDGNSSKFKNFKRLMIANRCPCSVCGLEYDSGKRFEVHHKDANRQNNDISNFCWCCVSCHKKLDYQLGRTKTYENGIPTETDVVKSIELIREDMTYDVTMADPAHNFVANNGLVVCNSHAAAYAIIAYMTAKQKAYYPAEFYAGLCNSYIGHSDFVKDSANEIVSDMRSHQVKIAPFSFRQDRRKCSVDEQKRILWGVPLIKGLNSATGEILYGFKDSHEIYLWSLFQKMIEAGITKSSLKTLIILGFFDDYGSVTQCSRILEVADNFKFGNRSSLSPEEVPDELKDQPSILTNRNSKGVELKKYKIVDGVALLNWFENNIRKEERRPLDYKTQIQNQKELLGFINLITLKPEDKPKLFIKEVYELKRKKDGKQFGYSIVTQSIGSGKESRFTVLNSLYKKEPIIKEDIILCKDYKRDGKYFTMTDYEHIYC